MTTIKKSFLQEELLHWYDTEYIILPWREDTDPYKVWISEIMLQQTRVETVIPYFERFMKELPTVYDLANANEDHLMKLWQGLGYYSRARNLQVAAKQIVNEYDGKMPQTQKELMKLKGIGVYTSGAIASIAFNQVAPAVDGNILRIFARLFGCKGDIRSTQIKNELTSLYTPYIPKKRPGDFNQALMDLGRKICISSKNPRCKECPLALKCYANSYDMQDTIPYLSKKKARTLQHITVVLYVNNDKIWVRKRKDKGLLASLYEYTTLDGHVSKQELLQTLSDKEAKIHKLPSSKHLFTHIEWQIEGYIIYTKENSIDPKGKFVDIDMLKTTYSIPTAFKIYTNWLLKHKKNKS